MSNFPIINRSAALRPLAKTLTWLALLAPLNTTLLAWPRVHTATTSPLTLSLPINTNLQSDNFSLPEAKAGAAYEFQFQTEGGLAPLKWVVNQLPPGLRLEENGKLHGTPTQAQAEAHAFAVTVSDASRPPQQFTLPCLLLVKAAPLRILTQANPLRILKTPASAEATLPAARTSEVAIPITAARRAEPSAPPAPALLVDDLKADLSDAPMTENVRLAPPSAAHQARSTNQVQTLSQAEIGMKCSSANRALLDQMNNDVPNRVKILEDYSNRCAASLIGLTYGGVVLSQQAQSFSQSDPFAGFTVGYRSGQSGKLLAPLKSHLNFRFQGLFSADARSATAPTLPELKDKFLFTDQTFLASRKSFSIEAQLWTERNFGRHLSLGPYFAWGGSTVLSRNEVQNESLSVEAATKNRQSANALLDTSMTQTDNDMKQYKEAGALISLYLLPSDAQRNSNPLFAQAILAYGNYEALKGLVPKSKFPFAKDTQNRFIGKLRVFPLGLKRDFQASSPVEHGPMFGVDLNGGYGPDQLKFFMGYVFSLRKVSDQ